MAHVELSVSEPRIGRSHAGRQSALERWAAAVAGAEEPCMVLDFEAVIIATSASFERILGLECPPVGRDVLGGVLRLLDFGDGAALDEGEISKIPPLLALSSGRLARGLMRIGTFAGDETACTLDAIATPLVESGAVTGSLTFFNQV